MSGIAEGAGISRQTLYKYFPDVDAIVVGLVERDSDHHLHDLKSSLDALDGPEARLRELVSHSIESHAHGSNPLHEAHLASERMLTVLEDHIEKTVELLESVLEDGVESGAVRDDIAVNILARAVSGILTAAIQPQPPESPGSEPAATAHAYYNLIDRMIAP
jgi:AcrR family transcriptional regulator